MPTKKEVANEACHCHNCDCGLMGGLLAIALTAILAVSVFACIKWNQALNAANEATNIANKIYQLNVLSAGWEANFNKLLEVYSSPDFIDYATSSTDSYAQQFLTTDESNNNEESDNNDSGLAPAGEILSAEDIAALKENGVIYGPENAKITILEFADASCGYCKRQVGQDQTIDHVMEQYPNDVNMMFKNMPIFNETAAEAMACSEDYLSAENYHQFVVAVFQMDDATSVDALATLAANYWADASTIANCVNNWEKADEVSTTMSEGSTMFGISGTPSSVIINNESGEYTLVPGAYPVDTFVEAIENFLN